MRATAIWLCLLLAIPAWAQDVTLEASAAQRCLTPVPEHRGTPTYPAAALNRGEAGRVKAALVFEGPDSPPTLQVLEQEGDSSFLNAVKAHVAEFRVPCLGRREAPAGLLIDFHFVPDRRAVVWSSPLDAAFAQQAKMLACVQTSSGSKQPEYPIDARRHEIQGRVLARLRFTAADQPPAVDVFARPQAATLAHAVAEQVRDYRMPCFTGAPLEAVWTFEFILDGRRYGFKPVTFMDVMSVVRDIRQQALEFDFTTMGCPFDVKLRYRRPFLPNAVGEVASEDPSRGTPVGLNPARRQFLDWLTQIEFDVPESTLNSVFGDSVTLTIPCIKINLNPKE